MVLLGFSYGPVLGAPLVRVGLVPRALVLYVVYSWYVLGCQVGAQESPCRCGALWCSIFLYGIIE